MTLLIAVLVRSLALGIGIAGYYRVAPTLMPDDDGLGSGLLAFLIIVTVSGCWGLFDGARREFGPVAVIWVTTGLLVAVGWWVVLSVAQADASMSATELLRSDLGLVPFTMSLMVLPALFAGGLGQVIRIARSPADTTPRDPRPSGRMAP